MYQAPLLGWHCVQHLYHTLKPEDINISIADRELSSNIVIDNFVARSKSITPDQMNKEELLLECIKLYFFFGQGISSWRNKSSQIDLGFFPFKQFFIAQVDRDAWPIAASVMSRVCHCLEVIWSEEMSKWSFRVKVVESELFWEFHK